MRSERLFELTRVLRAQGVTSVPALAERFGVSARTIARDLALLREQEVPIEGVPGPAGGVRLLRASPARETNSAPLVLGDEEVAALWLSVWLTASTSRARAASPAVSAFEKIEALLPRGQRQRLHALAQGVLVGGAASRNLVRGTMPPAPAVVVALATALGQQCALEMTYEDREGHVTERSIEPHAVLVQVPLWYVLAIDRVKAAPRSFRLDRILQARALPGEGFPRRQIGPLFPELAASGLTPQVR